MIINASQTKSILGAAGWHLAEHGTPPTPYDHFVRHLGFSLQREILIDPSADSVGFDMNVVHAGTEYELRRLLYKVFLKAFESKECYAICVNFGEWVFTPGDLRITSHFEPFPVSVTPYAEYVVFGSGDFSHGVFCNPTNNHLVVFGNSFVTQFSELLRDRLVNAQAAARHRQVVNQPDFAGD